MRKPIIFGGDFISENYQKLDFESFEDYMVRLYMAYENKEISNKEIATLLNKASGWSKDEDTYKRFYNGFAAGRKYEHNLLYGDVKDRVLVISDLHVPFNLSVNRYSKYSGTVDTLVLGGDLVDMQAISKFPKVYRSSPMNEIILCRGFIIELLETIQPKRVIIIYGNHELRFQAYLSSNIDTDLINLMPKTPLDYIFFDGLTIYDHKTKTKTIYDPLANLFDNIEFIYNNNWWEKYGETIFCHPQAYSSGILKTAENAVLFFRNEGVQFTSLVMTHTHHIGRCVIGNTDVFECGCSCDTKQMTYSDGKLVNSQKEGCLYLFQDKTGKLINHNQERWN